MYPKNEKVPAPLKFPIIGTPAGNLSHRYFTLSSMDAVLPEEDKLTRMLWLRSPFYRLIACPENFFHPDHFLESKALTNISAESRDQNTIIAVSVRQKAIPTV